MVKFETLGALLFLSALLMNSCKSTERYRNMSSSVDQAWEGHQQWKESSCFSYKSVVELTELIDLKSSDTKRPPLKFDIALNSDYDHIQLQFKYKMVSGTNSKQSLFIAGKLIELTHSRKWLEYSMILPSKKNHKAVALHLESSEKNLHLQLKNIRLLPFTSCKQALKQCEKINEVSQIFDPKGYPKQSDGILKWPLSLAPNETVVLRAKKELFNIPGDDLTLAVTQQPIVVYGSLWEDGPWNFLASGSKIKALDLSPLESWQYLMIVNKSMTAELRMEAPRCVPLP